MQGVGGADRLTENAKAEAQGATLCHKANAQIELEGAQRTDRQVNRFDVDLKKVALGRVRVEKDGRRAKDASRQLCTLRRRQKVAN